MASQKVPINYCSFDDLLDLPGVGKAIASKIMDLRDIRGSLEPDDLIYIPRLRVSETLLDLIDFTPYKVEPPLTEEEIEHQEKLRRVDALVRSRSGSNEFKTLSSTGFGQPPTPPTVRRRSGSYSRSPSPHEEEEWSEEEGDLDSAFYAPATPKDSRGSSEHGLFGREIAQKLNFDETPYPQQPDGQNRYTRSQRRTDRDKSPLRRSRRDNFDHGRGDYESRREGTVGRVEKRSYPSFNTHMARDVRLDYEFGEDSPRYGYRGQVPRSQDLRKMIPPGGGEAATQRSRSGLDLDRPTPGSRYQAKNRYSDHFESRDYTPPHHSDSLRPDNYDQRATPDFGRRNLGTRHESRTYDPALGQNEGYDMYDPRNSRYKGTGHKAPQFETRPHNQDPDRSNYNRASQRRTPDSRFRPRPETSPQDDYEPRSSRQHAQQSRDSPYDNRRDYNGRSHGYSYGARTDSPYAPPTHDRQENRESRGHRSHGNQRNVVVPKTMKYDGKTNWQAFYAKFTRYSEVNEWSPEECMNHLCWALEGKASEFYALLVERNRDMAYPDLVRKLEKRFGFKELPETSLVQFNSARQSSEESLEDWADRVLTLAMKAFRNLPERHMYQQAIMRLCQGAADKDAGSYASNIRPSSMEEAVDKMRWFHYNHQAIFGRTPKREVKCVQPDRGFQNSAEYETTPMVQTASKAEPPSVSPTDLKNMEARLDSRFQRQVQTEVKGLRDQMSSDMAEVRKALAALGNPQRDYKSPRPSSPRSRSPSPSMQNARCFGCNEVGHYKRDCPNRNKPPPKSGEKRVTFEDSDEELNSNGAARKA